MEQGVISLYAMRARRKGYEVSTMKALMDMAGLHGGLVRPPLVNVRAAEQEELRVILAQWKPFL
jgi:5-dehydro-4-deoxyglucarate dehydratase